MSWQFDIMTLQKSTLKKPLEKTTDQLALFLYFLFFIRKTRQQLQRLQNG